MSLKLRGLVAATHTPLDAHGELNLDAIQTQAAHLMRNGVDAVFVGGTTGESHSLTVEERLALALRWSEVLRGTCTPWVVHVGANCLADARTLARQAAQLGATALAALAPSYFKPRSVDALVACCEHLAAAAPETPFYFYDIPSMTGVSLPMDAFLDQASGVIPTLAGIKYSNPDLMQFQRCLHLQGGRFDILWGTDEYLLAAMAVGAEGAVGSSYNFAAPIYRRMMKSQAAGDLATARAEQYRSVQVIHRLARHSYMAAAKAVMGWLGVPVGPPRLPHFDLTPEERYTLRDHLERMGFFDWIKSAQP
jgi:N-acetylneuraminate lyase